MDFSAAKSSANAGTGPRNYRRVRAWKYELQQRVVDRFGLSVTICHYPTGTSKRNPIEHRVFSEISQHWAGQPLDSYETVQRLIGETTTQRRLEVSAFIISKHYETGQKVSDQQVLELLRNATETVYLP